jgi:signal transduction histidine kinase
VALIALYQDWVPFLSAIAFVALDHGLIGTLYPTWVYNHPAAIANPWLWAGAHAGLVLAEAIILIVAWKASEQNRARADLVLSAAGEGIVGVDRAGRVTFANAAASEMLGRKADALVDAPIAQVLAARMGAGDLPDVGGPHGGVAASASRGQLVLGSADDAVPIDWSLNPIFERRAAVGAVLTLSDASDRVQAERELSSRIQQMRELERLKEMDAFKTVFINTAAHELHTPLTPLRLNVFALKEGHRGELSADQRSTVDVLDRNVERLTKLVEDVLNVARLQANRFAISKQRMDLGASVAESVASFQESCRHAGLRLETNIARDVFVEADARRFAQVVYNLLDNAIKFTTRGGLVRVEVLFEGGDAVLRVVDTGFGLRAADIPKLFHPFSQLDALIDRTRAGSGLGLYICRGIVELHGGTISCNSEGPGKGSTFTVRLPPADSAPQTEQAVANHKSALPNPVLINGGV